MSSAVHWVLELNIKDGAYDDFEALMNEMVDATEANEPGAKHYEWYVSEDKKKCSIYERYEDSAAVMVHLGNFGAHFAERFLGALEPTRFIVFGDASSEVREALAGFGAVYMAEVGGFAR